MEMSFLQANRLGIGQMGGGPPPDSRRPGRAGCCKIIELRKNRMKVVLFCGGLGMRLREYSEIIPKPMVNIGYRPILWHVMKYYAHFGHKEFILCLGYKADIIKNYFLNYNEYLSNDFVLTKGGKDLQLIHSDIDDWKITFVDTGLTSNIGQRLKAVQQYVAGDEMFLANYTDGLSDCPLPVLIDTLKQRGEDGDLPLDAAGDHVPHRLDRRERRRQRHRGRLEVGDLDQRRVLRLPQARSSTTSGRARSSCRSPSSA